MRIPATTVKHNVGMCPSCRDYLWAEVDIEVNVSEPTMTREGKANVYVSPKFVGMRVTHTCAADSEGEPEMGETLADKVRTLADQWDAEGWTTVYETGTELAQALRALLESEDVA